MLQGKKTHINTHKCCKEKTHTHIHTHPTKGSKQSSLIDSTGAGMLAPKYEANNVCQLQCFIGVDKFENKK